MKDKLVRLTTAVLSGGFIVVHTSREVRIFILAFFILLLVRLWFFWKPQDFLGRVYRPEVLLLACSIICGYLYGMTAEKLFTSPLIIEEIEVEGKLTDWMIDDLAGRGIFTVQGVTDATKVKRMAEVTEGSEVEPGRKYMVRVYPDNRGIFKEEWNRVKPGDRLRISGRLEHPKPPGTAGEFDLQLYNAARGLSGTITARGKVTLLEEGVPNIPWRIRKNVRDVLDEHWPSEAGVLEGILFGDSTRISSETLDMYKAAGVMHVFAASGANVAFVMALAWGAFFFLPRRVRILAVIGSIILYAALCQGNPPILRATILGMAFLVGMLGRGKMSSLRWLLFAALILFIINPLYLKDISFQLSFAAAWGMSVLTPHIKKIRWINKLPGWLKMSAAVSLSAQIAALPILIAVFNRVSLAGFITNVVMLFLLGAVLQLGLLGTIFVTIPLLPLGLFQVAFWLLGTCNYFLSMFADFPFAYLWVLNPGIIFWILWYCSLGILLYGKEKAWFILRVQIRRFTRHFRVLLGMNDNKDNDLSSRREGIIPRRILIIMLFSIVLWSPWSVKDRLLITFLDVGQGDCILIQTSQEKLLIDTGPKIGNFDTGERILVPYLMEKRIGYLDMVFITHEDNDHIGGAKYLLSNVPTGAVAVPEVEARLENENWLESIPPEFLHDQKKLVRLKAGDRLEFSSGLKIEVIAPVTVIGRTTADANNNSLVFLLEYLGRRILFSGDMENDEIQQISDRGAEWDADFIKVPHHGGKGSLNSSWFDKTNPLAVFIPVGRNSFGHPSQEVLTYWQEREVPILRTDLHGTIQLEIDRDSFRIIPGRV